MNPGIYPNFDYRGKIRSGWLEKNLYVYHCLSKLIIRMKRLAFKMKLNPGQEATYKKRHDEIWPELVELLKDSGISGYSIFLDQSTLSLFGFLNTDNPVAFEQLSQSPVMQRWWQYMKDIMETNTDGSPVALSLDEVFHLP